MELVLSQIFLILIFVGLQEDVSKIYRYFSRELVKIKVTSSLHFKRPHQNRKKDGLVDFIVFLKVYGIGKDLEHVLIPQRKLITVVLVDPVARLLYFIKQEAV